MIRVTREEYARFEEQFKRSYCKAKRAKRLAGGSPSKRSKMNAYFRAHIGETVCTETIANLVIATNNEAGRLMACLSEDDFELVRVGAGKWRIDARV